MKLVYAITWLVFVWAFLGYLLWQVVAAARWRRQQRREQVASDALYGQGVRVLAACDVVYDQEREPDPIPTRIVSGPRAPRLDRW
jgi:hypothetical protein